MKLIRLSGHSGAGKSRLLTSLKKKDLEFKKALLYTSRERRPGEIDGIDYFFRSKSDINHLPQDRFLKGHVREMLQAVDLVQLKNDIRNSYLVIVEIYYAFWLDLQKVLLHHFHGDLKIASVFLTAINPIVLKNKSLNESSKIIRIEVEKILQWRNIDTQDKILLKSKSAIQEILTAIQSHGMYDKIIFSSPEGPDGKDEWTLEDYPIGSAKRTLNEFMSLIEDL